MKTAMAVVFTTFLSIACFSAEADHYTRSEKELKDSAEIINAKANAYLQQGLDKINAVSPCVDSEKSEQALYKELTNYFANHNHGKLIQDILERDEVDKRRVLIKDSIYSAWNVTDGYLLGRKKAGQSKLGLMPLLRIGDQYIGADKLEHMFGMGLIYHSGITFKGKTLKDVLKNGILREKTALGGNMVATGVFSYGDLSANFNGMRFWNHLLQKRDDVLGVAYNVGPYVRCEAGKWKTTEFKIDFRNYVDASMDESINCRKLATKDGVEKSVAAMKARGFSECPRDAKLLEQMQAKYNVLMANDPTGLTISHWIINMKGLGQVNYFGEFKQ
tara:strand:- start:15672 stop:16667 length:996 start_codon:yes stop_codon:yes gene_type:complete